MRWPRRILPLPLVLLALVPGCRRPSKPAHGAETHLTLKGSDTLVLLGQRWAEDFAKTHPEANIQVNGGGSGTGIAALIDGATDIAMASRPLQEAERDRVRQRSPQGPVELPVARDGIAFYVHESNPVSALTLAQLRGIYLGDVRRWKDVGGPDTPIIVYARESSSGTYVYLKDTLLGGQDFTERAQPLPGTAAVVNAVSLEKNGIGFGGAAYLRGVKALRIGATPEDAVALSAESLRAGTYPLGRALYFDLARPPTGLAKDFIDHALSEPGQRRVVETGFFPVQ
jgi:phosphate transport system substrate-binding protein